VPPFLQSGERLLPARARPVDFCLYGFLPPPLTSPRVLVICVPWPLIGKVCNDRFMHKRLGSLVGEHQLAQPHGPLYCIIRIFNIDLHHD
jgi:hypothetical protein